MQLLTDFKNSLQILLFAITFILVSPTKIIFKIRFMDIYVRKNRIFLFKHMPSPNRFLVTITNKANIPLI